VCYERLHVTEEELINSYNDAWNAHDVEALAAFHAPDIVFHNYSADERVEGADAVKAHIAGILSSYPDLQFRGRRLYASEGLVVSEWTATATRDGQKYEWDGVDVFPIEGEKIKRKDVYTGAGVARPV
jgi:steroid delta-isomerase-like uncharacterized protein